MQKFQKSIFQTTWHGPLQSIDITYETPDFSKIEPTKWGDWGPYYDFALSPSDPFIIYYSSSNEAKKVVLNLTEVTLEAPFLQEMRQHYTLTLKLHDIDNNFISELFFNKEGSIVAANVAYMGQPLIKEQGAYKCYEA